MTPDQHLTPEQQRAPIVEALAAHAARERVSCHVPGHKGRSRAAAAFEGVLRFDEVLRLDATELPGLDDLHDPRGAIFLAQRLAAEAWGTDCAHFLTGGGTSGNLCAILSAVRPGDTVIVGRNAHQSVWNALDMARAGMRVVVSPETFGGMPGRLAEDAVSDAIARHPGARAVIVTSPTYGGAVSDVRAIAKLADRAGMIAIVDEAHGAHLRFHPVLPPSAVESGADLIVHSPHKMLAALTQTGLLHVNGRKVDRDRLRRVIRRIESSSPSYLLLASLDEARREIFLHGEALLGTAVEALEAKRAELEAASPGFLRLPAPREWTDPFKWILDAGALGMRGGELAEILNTRFGIFPEYSDGRFVLLVWSYASSLQGINRVGEALKTLQKRNPRRPAEGVSDVADPGGDRIQCVWPIGDADEQRSVRGTLENAVGRRVADHLTVYPPGVPEAVAGEILTEEAYGRLVSALARGDRVDGVSSGAVATVRYLEC